MSKQRPRELDHGLSWFPARTPTLPPATHTNSYAIGGRQVLLVEPATPYEDEQRAWLQWARAIESQGRELQAIFVTHHHPDHVGGAQKLSRELELPLWAHHRCSDLLQNVSIARTLGEGDVLPLDGPSPQRWRCLHTPGHAPDHLCLHEPSLGVAIVGDMVASEGTIVIDPFGGDLVDYLAQLERLAELDAELALPAHGDPINEPTALFRYYISHRLEREAKVIGALDATGPGPAGLDQLVPIAYDDTPEAMWPFAKLSLQSHLLKLEREGRARRCDQGWQQVDD